jgi:hypothetical protein
MDIVSFLSDRLSHPVHQLVIPADTLSERGSDVVVQLCSGHSVFIPDGILAGSPGKAARDGGGGGPSASGKHCVALRLSDEVPRDEAEFLQRLVSAAVGLATRLQAAGAGLPLIDDAPGPGGPVRLVVHPSALDSSEATASHSVGLGPGLTVAIPASLVDVEPLESPGPDAGGSTGFSLAFKPGARLAPVLNQLVRVILELGRMAP